MMHLLRRLRLNGVPAAAAVLLLAGCSPDGASATEAFPVDRFLESEANFAGNRYRLRASIDKQLGWEEGTGRVVVVKPEGETQSRIAVFIPARVDASIYAGQRYEMDVRIAAGGLVYVEQLRKF